MRQKNGQDLVLKMIAVKDDIPNIEPVGGFLGKVGIKLDIQSGDFNFLLAAAAKDPFNITLFSGSGYDSPGLVHRFFNSKGIFSYFDTAGEVGGGTYERGKRGSNPCECRPNLCVS